MLVVFTNKNGATVEMFEKAALALIKLMGCREAVPSAIKAEDLPKALETLQNALAEVKKEEEAAEQEDELDDDEDKPKSIGMSTRAFPLIELMQHSVKHGSYLMWDHR